MRKIKSSILKSCGLITLGIFLSIAKPTMAQEIILRPGDVLNLGLSKKNILVLDRVTMQNKSVMVIPRSFKNFDLTINHLSVTGTAYLYVYDDKAVAPIPKPAKLNRAAVCESGAIGITSPSLPPRTPQELKFNFGFSGIEKLIIVAEGASGSRGADGGDGQDGGDSGGKDRCVVQSCDGGKGGNSGLGAAGGDGGDGPVLTLRYSGIGPEQIHQNPAGEQSSGGIGRDLVGVLLQPKPLFNTPPNNEAVDILRASIGQAEATNARDPGPLPTAQPEFPGTTIPIVMALRSLEAASKPGVNFWTTGGAGGSGGRDGLPGFGGAGFRCTLGRDQKVGADGTQTFGVGRNGKTGKVGSVRLEKTD